MIHLYNVSTNKAFLLCSLSYNYKVILLYKHSSLIFTDQTNLNINTNTNQISKVGSKDQLWIDSDDFYLEIELISHRKETKVISKMNFGIWFCIK